MSVSGSGVPNRCIDFEDLSVIKCDICPDQIRPCPAFSGLGSSDENCRDPKSAGGWKAEHSTALALGLGGWSFPVTAAGLERGFLEFSVQCQPFQQFWDGGMLSHGLQWQSLPGTSL